MDGAGWDTTRVRRRAQVREMVRVTLLLCCMVGFARACDDDNSACASWAKAGEVSGLREE